VRKGGSGRAGSRDWAKRERERGEGARDAGEPQIARNNEAVEAGSEGDTLGLVRDPRERVRQVFGGGGAGGGIFIMTFRG